MTIARRLLGLDQPQEVRVFVLVSGFGLVVTLVYWLVAYEPAGTVLLAGFTAATGLLALRLATDPRAALVRRRMAARPALDPAGGPVDASGGGTADVERPFVDESGPLPGESTAPFAVGLGVAIAATGLVFGPAPIVVGILPLAWGAWSWLTEARAELDEMVAAEVPAPAADVRPPPRVRGAR